MLTTILTVASIWFHLVATIVIIGHYLLLVLVTLPVLKKSFQGQALLQVLEDISREIQPRLLASLGVFFITGIYLMLINDSYQSVGQFTNLWSVLMLVKHFVVVGMIVLGVMLNNTVKAGQASGGE